MVIDIVPLSGRQIDRTRQIIHHRIEKRLDPLILKGRTTNHRNDPSRDGLTAEGDLKIRHADLLFSKKLQTQLIIEINETILQFRESLFDHREVNRRNFANLIG